MYVLFVGCIVCIMYNYTYMHIYCRYIIMYVDVCVDVYSV